MRRAVAVEATSSDATAIGIAAVNVAVYLGGLFFFCATSGAPRVVGLAVASFAAVTLFVVGHDACHRSLAKTPWLNDWIAHLAFMPTLHPQAAWARGHNWRHHGFTNLRGFDYVWEPWSPRDYLDVSPGRRARYRFFRTLAGFGLYYTFEIWIPHGWRSDVLDRSYPKQGEIRRDRIVASAGFLTIWAAAVACGLIRGVPTVDAAIVATVAVVMPLVTLLVSMSVIIFLHHTHPGVRWFASKETYDPSAVHARDTVHVRFPVVFELLSHQIFQHPAHHLDPRIPLYRLARAQRTLEQASDRATVVETFSLAYLLRILRECQLYDFEQRRWIRCSDAAGFARETAPDASVARAS